MKTLEQQAFKIGYSQSKAGAICIPSMNPELQEFMSPFPNCHETRMSILKGFVAGANKATDEKLEALMAE
jgi:hypothetical protein